jgi:hypothetical protein
MQRVHKVMLFAQMEILTTRAVVRVTQRGFLSAIQTKIRKKTCLEKTSEKKIKRYSENKNTKY